MERYKKFIISTISILNIIILFFNVFLFNNANKANEFKKTTIKLAKTDYRDGAYKIFYGKWKVDKILALDSRWGISDESKKLIGQHIEYSFNSVKINNTIVLNKPMYRVTLAPVDPNLSVVENLPNLRELGIQGKYFACVSIDNFYKAKNPFFGVNFFVKDDSTLIIYENNLYFELKRISHLGNSTVTFPG